MKDAAAALVWSTFPDRAAVRMIAAKLLDARLIACANIVSEMESIFTWQGKVQSGQECGVLFKTQASQLEALIARIGELHPYETPVILGWHCDKAYPATLDWLKHSLQSD